jgi:hypothetical protein
MQVLPHNKWIYQSQLHIVHTCFDKTVVQKVHRVEFTFSNLATSKPRSAGNRKNKQSN